MLYDYSYWIFKQCPIIHTNPYFYQDYSFPSRKIGKKLKPYLYNKRSYYRCRDKLY